jgi:hypothetical protein
VFLSYIKRQNGNFFTASFIIACLSFESLEPVCDTCFPGESFADLKSHQFVSGECLAVSILFDLLPSGNYTIALFF